jgi:F-type H+-transporting ATPase subunit gamma
MDFINTLVQRLRNVQLLPLSQSEEYRDETMVVPEVKAEYVFEPDPKQILNELLPYYIENTLYQTLLESRASEQSARMVSMKNASENAKELVHELKLLYNKSRQAAITSELLDITTATLTLS